MSKRQREETIESMAKKPRIAKIFNYDEKIKFLSELSDNLTQYSAIYHPQNDPSKNDIILHAKKTTDIIPTVVTFGKQSAGKSTVYKLTFGIDHRTGTGTSTRCPIIYRLGPKYQNKVYVKEYYTNSVKYCSNVNEAEQFADELAKQYNCPIIKAEIICEMNNPNNFSMIDLPGFIDDPHYQLYFNDLKNMYLNKKETIILHVVKADDDRETDISVKFLNGCHNTIITVLTHADYWMVDKEKINCANKHLYDPRVKGLAVITNHKDEYEMLHSMNLQFKTDKSVIVSSKNLKEYILTELKNKTTELYPEIEKCVMLVLDAINKELSIIGRQKPDMREACAHLRNYYTDKVKMEFNSSGSQLSPIINSIREIISPNIIISLISLVPSFDRLAEELKMGRRREVQGTEGWDAITKKYVGNIINEMKNGIVLNYIKRYFDAIGTRMRVMIQEKYKPYSEKVQHDVNGFIADQLRVYYEEIVDEVNEYLDSIANDPYNADDNYINNYQRSMIEDPLKLAIEYFSQFNSKVEALEKAMTDVTGVIDYVQKRLGDNGDQYKIKAKTAYNQITSFWRSESVQIHNNLIEIMSKFERKYEKKLIDRIQMVNYDDLSEPESVEYHRKMLLELVGLCETLLE